MNHARRTWLAAASASCLALALDAVSAGPPVVEVIAFAHPPVQSALKPLRDWLARLGSKVRVVEIDMESPEAARRLQAVGLQGHVPIVILIDGQYRHRRADGSTVDFVNFPAAPGSPSGMKGSWSTEDIEVVLKARP